MKAILPLAVAGLILSFLIGALSSFPIHAKVDSPPVAVDPNDDSFSVEKAQEAGNRFSSVYTSVIDDMLSFQKDPDYKRAESQRNAMVAYSESLITQFQDFSAKMKGKLDQLAPQAGN